MTLPMLLRQSKAVAETLQPALLLLLRFWMAHIFWTAGQVKIHDWPGTLYLFQTEYHVPLLPPNVAALAATAFELISPILLTLGLGTRLAVLPLLGMTAVIQFTYDANDEHLYWAMLLGTLLAFGAGAWSVDRLVIKRWLHA